MVFAREQRNAVLKRAITRLLAEDLDLSPADLAYRARMSVNAAKGGRARAKALTPARRRAIAKHAAATVSPGGRPMAKGREWGRLYKQRNSRFWWYRIGFRARIIWVGADPISPGESSPDPGRRVRPRR